MKKQIESGEIVSSSIFFKPNTEMVKWLIKYAGNRIIIDAGCGERFLLCQQLISNGAKALVGIDTQANMNLFFNWKQMNYDKWTEVSFHIMQDDILHYKDFFAPNARRETLLIFARPCHSNWVKEVLDAKGDKCEVLYITIPENLTKYDDLGKWKEKAKLLEHKGSSADREVVYSIK